MTAFASYSGSRSLLEASLRMHGCLKLVCNARLLKTGRL